MCLCEADLGIWSNLKSDNDMCHCQLVIYIIDRCTRKAVGLRNITTAISPREAHLITVADSWRMTNRTVINCAATVETSYHTGVCPAEINFIHIHIGEYYYIGELFSLQLHILREVNMTHLARELHFHCHW